MTFLHLIFLAFATAGILSALMVVGSNNPVHGVLCLVMTFFSTAGVWIILHAEFLALILVLVYVGAVMTLFLFVVMMLNVDLLSLKKSFVRYLPFAILIILLMVGVMMLVVGSHQFDMTAMPDPAIENNITQLGMVLYSDYAYPFEIAAVLLLTAIVAAISLSLRAPRQRKVQDIAKQIAVCPKDRVTLINMPAEKKGDV